MPEKMADERNFRSIYYEKVGCKSVEERKSLETLLKEDPINLIKLKNFCLRFTTPASHRQILWNLLLGTAPLHQQAHQFVMEQRVIVYQDLHRALVVMRMINETMPKAKIFYSMWLLENRKLYLGCNINSPSTFTTIATCLLEVFDNDVETYWICKGFHELTVKIETELPMLISLTQVILEQEDHETHSHLIKIGALNRLPYDTWYPSSFAGILYTQALIRIWDKICGGSIKIVSFVLIVMLITYKRNILRMTDSGAVIKQIENIRDEHEAADLIVNKAIELWQANKRHNEFQSHQFKGKH